MAVGNWPREVIMCACSHCQRDANLPVLMHRVLHLALVMDVEM